MHCLNLTVKQDFFAHNVRYLGSFICTEDPYMYMCSLMPLVIL